MTWGRKPSLLKGLLILMVRAWQRLIAPWLPPSCRFEPSCSQYMLEALEKRGILRGVSLGLWRILRCNPWCPGGVDPVPESKNPGRPVRGILLERSPPPRH